MFQVILAMLLFQSVNYIVIELGIALLAMWFFHTPEQKVENELLISGAWNNLPQHLKSLHPTSFNYFVKQLKQLS